MDSLGFLSGWNGALGSIILEVMKYNRNLTEIPTQKMGGEEAWILGGPQYGKRETLKNRMSGLKRESRKWNYVYIGCAL